MSNRIFYAVQNVNLAGIQSGFQSVGINATVDFEQIFELGRLDIYQNLEGVPSVEVTLERLLLKDRPTLWETVCSNTVTGASNARPNLQMSVADDETFTSSNFVQCTGLYVSNYSVNFQIDGPMTESMTLVGNALDWTTGSAQIQTSSTGNAVVSDASAAGAIIRRQDVTNVSPKLQSASFSIDFSREDLFELGRKTPYYKAAGFPVEVTGEFEYLASVGNTGLTFEDGSSADITSDVAISIGIGSKGFSMGSSARLTGTNYSGGDAGGGNATVTYSYVTYNFFEVT